MKTKTNWQELYTDLSTSLAKKLRDARVQPEKLKTMTNSEILSIDGIGAVAVEKIRAAYPIASVEQTQSEKPSKTKKKSTKKDTIKVSKTKKSPSPRLQLLKKQVKSDKLYPLKEALELLVKFNKNRKTKTVELHINTLDKGIKGEVSLPHSTGKKQTIEIFSDKTVVKINAGKLDFSILLATPADMPKLARHAKILGPKGLMPTPKNGNLIEDTKKRLEELSTGATLAYKTEPKFPIMHLSLGSSTQKLNHLQENISTLVKHINLTKVKSIFLTSTQTPSIKLDVSSL
jgi:large subunit ribosomal protein L1